jgi:adenine phosphoribosyltransferase
MKIKDIKHLVRDVPNFPKEGVIFKDITPILKNYPAVKFVTTKIANYFKHKNVNKVVSMESRGFIFGSIISQKLKCGFVPVRKKGKLPYKTISIEYSLEYGTDVLEIHEDAIEKGENVLIIDDVLATGGTAEAVINLIKKCGGNVVGLGFLIELTFLNPRKKLVGQDIYSLIKY